ncbi:MAG: YicC family protein [Rhizobiales bacterium]|nr:YicC family protein [Hyphomicrobiales bacterium]
MALQSMTGFARATGVHPGNAFAWELKSVNGKGLEVRLRLPPGLERIEQPAKQAFRRQGADATPIVNEVLLGNVAALAKRLEEEFGVAPARADGLLALRGVLEFADPLATEEEAAAFDAVIMTALDEALDGLVKARLEEGAALGRLLLGHVDEIEALTLQAEADPSREPQAIRAKLAEQVRLVMDAMPTLDESRLNMEAAFLATKADIREELDRLKTHVAAVRSLLGAGGPVGRKLDFLSQEFIRESNTLCSKSNAVAITAIGLELKAVVDRFREQVQNLE